MEGYTDVLAMRQAAIENAVGVMGTAFTDEQAARAGPGRSDDSCSRLMPTRAGQEAMLRAARVAQGRDLELRVVPLPPGLDPADLLQREGPEAMRERIGGSAPFISFYVDRILARVEGGGAEDTDRAIGEIAPVLREFVGDRLQHAVLRQELLRRVASRLQLSEHLVETLLAGGGGSGPVPVPGRRPAAPADTAAVLSVAARASLGQQERNERTFLALCAAFPREGAELLSHVVPAEHLTSDVTRRAARHLAGHLDAPLDALPDDDPEVAAVLSEIAARVAARSASASPGNLEHAWLSLELARLERAIDLARGSAGAGDGSGPSVSRLSGEREQVRTRLRTLSGKLQSV